MAYTSLLLALTVSAAHAQDAGRILGRVLDDASNQPLEGAEVRVLGLPSGAVADANGEYLLTVPPDLHTITATRVGYASASATVRVSPGASIPLDFRLTSTESPQEPILVGLAPEDSVATARLPLPYADDAIVRHRQIGFAGFEPSVGTMIEVALFDDMVLRVRADRVENRADDRFDLIGSIRLPGTEEPGTAIMLVRSGQLNASFHVDGRRFEVMPFQGSHHVVVELTSTGGSGEELIPPLPLPEPRPWPWPIPVPFPPWPLDLFPEFVVPVLPISPQTCGDLPNLMAGPYPQVRVLALFSEATVAAGGNLPIELELRVLEVNGALEKSRITPRIALVGALPVTVGDDGAVGGSDFLTRLIEPADGHLDDVFEWRDERFADVVLLYTQNVAGLGAAETLEVVSLDNRDRAFVVVNRQLALSDLGFAHEIGHVLGAQHDRASGAPVGKPYRYNHGHVIDAATTTIMAIPTGTRQRALHYSNPSVAYAGAPTGIVSSSTQGADNSRALTNTAGVTSAFRLTPDWFYSSAAKAPWNARLATESGMPDVRFADLDGDGERDAFRIDLADGEWLWSRSASEEWRSRNGPNPALAVPLAELAFGDFDGDGADDVFWPDVAGNRWLWSPGGAMSWQVLNGPDASLTHPIWELAFGDFDADSDVDVLRTDHVTGEWFWSPGGASAWQQLNPPHPSRALRVENLAFGDFDGDGKADVLRTVPSTSTWQYSSGGSGAWQLRSTGKPESLSQLGFGDFDGDGRVDAFKTTGREWMVSDGALGPWTVVRQSCHRLPVLRFGDFDGDGTTDVIRAGIRP